MPRGGARVGAGRPRKSGREHWLTGDAGKRKLALVPASPADPSAPVSETSVIQTPVRLSKEARAYWDEWAPMAIALGTLVPENVPGFELLCAEAAHRDSLTLSGLTDVRAEMILRLESLRQKATKQVEQLMARYGLAAMGKPMTTPKPQVNDELEQLRRLLTVS